MQSSYFEHSDTALIPPRWPMVVAVLLHVALVAALVLVGLYLPKSDPLDNLPAAVELWEGGRPPQPVVEPVTQPVQAPVKRAVIKTPEIKQADIKITPEEIPRPQPRERKRPDPVQPPPVPADKPKPAPRTEPRKTAARQNTEPDVEDLLSGIDGPGRRGTGSAERSQRGGNTGSSEGTPGGRANFDPGPYKRKVIERVRSAASKPPGSSGSRVTVSVRLDPDMRVQRVSVTKSSGDATYDQAVVDGVHRVGQFPPIPDGAPASEFRSISLNVSLR